MNQSWKFNSSKIKNYAVLLSKFKCRYDTGFPSKAVCPYYFHKTYHHYDVKGVVGVGGGWGGGGGWVGRGLAYEANFFLVYVLLSFC